MIYKELFKRFTFGHTKRTQMLHKQNESKMQHKLQEQTHSFYKINVHTFWSGLKHEKIKADSSA